MYEPNGVIIYLGNAWLENFSLDAKVLHVQDTAPLIPMQFTGLLDKNGKEIFEGDILASRQYGTDKLVNFFAVEWDIAEAGWNPFADSSENCGCCGGGKKPSDYEVVGNIYENSELLDV